MGTIALAGCYIHWKQSSNQAAHHQLSLALLRDGSPGGRDSLTGRPAPRWRPGLGAGFPGQIWPRGTALPLDYKSQEQAGVGGGAASARAG